MLLPDCIICVFIEKRRQACFSTALIFLALDAAAVEGLSLALLGRYLEDTTVSYHSVRKTFETNHSPFHRGSLVKISFTTSMLIVVTSLAYSVFRNHRHIWNSTHFGNKNCRMKDWFSRCKWMSILFLALHFN